MLRIATSQLRGTAPSNHVEREKSILEWQQHLMSLKGQAGIEGASFATQCCDSQG